MPIRFLLALKGIEYDINGNGTASLLANYNSVVPKSVVQLDVSWDSVYMLLTPHLHFSNKSVIICIYIMTTLYTGPHTGYNMHFSSGWILVRFQ